MDQIFDLVYNSNGGFNFTEIYEMPVNVRSYYYYKLAKTLEEKAKAIEEANRGRGKGS